VSQPEERFCCIPVKDLAATVEQEQIKRQTLIIIGKTLEYGSDTALSATSKLYAEHFSHGFRQ
jgi:precorrin-4 methylase